MLMSMGSACRPVAVALGAGAIACAILCSSAPIAAADPPPNCTAADLAGISSGVSAGESTYMFAHPDVNDFFTGLKGQAKDKVEGAVQTYLNANPQTESDLEGIRQPLVDFKNRCGG